MVAAHLPLATGLTALPLPHRAPDRAVSGDDPVRRWYENELGWPTVPASTPESPVRLRLGVRFDVLDVPAEAGRAALRHLAEGSPVALWGDRLLLLVAAGSAEELPGILEWLEWGPLPLDLRALGTADSMPAPPPPGPTPDGHAREARGPGGPAGAAWRRAPDTGGPAGAAQGPDGRMVSPWVPAPGADALSGEAQSPGERTGVPWGQVPGAGGPAGDTHGRSGPGRTAWGPGPGTDGLSGVAQGPDGHMRTAWGRVPETDGLGVPGAGGRAREAQSAGRPAETAWGQVSQAAGLAGPGRSGPHWPVPGAAGVIGAAQGRVPAPAGSAGRSPASGTGGPVGASLPGGGRAVPGALQGAAVWLRPPEPGCEVEASLPTVSALGGGGGAPDLVRVVNTVATQCHRLRLRRARA
ncbi:hypothetical protein M2161_005485 [Streptomyces sp. SAI-133]|nr:hypothetical protein [Streptomyces sp. SAI-133]